MKTDIKQAAEIVAAASPAAEPHGGGKRLSFQGLHPCTEKPTAEAQALHRRVTALLREHLTNEDRELMREFQFTPSIYNPVSKELPEPPESWHNHVRKIAEARAVELHPGWRVAESWVFRLHDELGVSVVILPPSGGVA